MVAWESWWTFVGVVLLLSLTPGPTVLLVASASLCAGRQGGRLAACGAALGCVPPLLVATLAIASLVHLSPGTLHVLRLVGAAYLAWLVFRTLSRALSSRRRDPAGVLPLASAASLTSGFLVSVCDPLLLGFYLSVLPQFVAPGRGHVAGQLLALGTTQIALELSINLALAQGIGTVGPALRSLLPPGRMRGDRSAAEPRARDPHA